MTLLAQFAATGGALANYIEDVFSSYLLVGNATTTTINNGIDLSGKGGLVWLKDRTGAGYHSLGDTARSGKRLFSNTTDAEVSANPFAFTSTGVTLNGAYLDSGRNFVTWTFREQEKFFDVVTWTGNGSNRTIAHNLGSVPGCIIVKRTDAAGYGWPVYHRSIGASQALELQITNAAFASTTYWNSTAPTSAVFSIGTDSYVNASGGTYVAYLFAHDAGGFGLTGSDNVISCGSFTTDGSGNATVNLGYEPQWVLFKASSRVLNWSIHDTMRGMPVGSVASGLYPNLADAESNNVTTSPTATGFTWSGYAGETFVYVAIRRGPMKVPTLGTTVFTPATYTGTGTAATITSAGFPVDLVIGNSRNAVSYGSTGAFGDRLRGKQNLLYSPSTGAEDTTNVSITGFDVQNGISVGGATAYSFNFATGSYVNWFLKRAPSFFDEVCDTGTGAAHTINHNLGIAPQLMIRKRRNSTSNWIVYPNDVAQVLFLDATNPFGTSGATYWNSTAPTSTVFSIGTNTDVNTNGGTYVTYLFATAPGVSKVGSYTGTGTTQTINCGFTAGSRFVMIKRTDVSGDWYVWDSARGIVSGNDPYLLLNSTAAEVTSTDYVDTANSGFELSSTAPAAINANGGSFIFLAIA